jgi:hypothetical protein
MNSGFLDRVTGALAPERLDSYRRDGAAAEVALARYLLNLALCEALYSPLHIAEVALRNTLHAALSTRYQANAWYELASVPLMPWQQDMVADARRRLEEGRKPVTPGRMVAELSFGFWTGLFNKRQARTGLGSYLARHALPHAPREERDLAKLDTRWERLRDLRNRVFHHERVVHYIDLDGQHADLLRMIGWISPELEQIATSLDRFTTVRREGLTPWLAALSHHWPHTP